ncbi:MAG: hypothetical protein ASARMPRED_008088 [Alectoria sarmentosa]|nr:MAG: hypothetical protein ASARMPRED_008088 [Alectoria sarmentosa]
MLPHFHIRNLQTSSQPKVSQDTLVRINAPCYDETISSHPAATLKYHDEDDGDMITADTQLGSSKELTEKLEEPVLPPSSRLLADLQLGVQPSEHHVFEIDDREYVRKLWQDIKDAEDVAVAQDWGDAMKWSVDKENKLANFYERRKREFWSPIAEELGVTWQSVDAMHWALGKEKMVRRAYEPNSRFEKSGSSEEIVEEKSDSSYNAPSTQHFEEYRVHYFNATRPPQVQPSMPVTSQPTKTTAGQATIQRASTVDLSRSVFTNTVKNGEANFIVEGKRQAQAAGDKLRARTILSSHQNRWANYKSSTSAFLPKALTSVSQAFDGPGLTSEGKRQAQVAGDKLRCRTNPIRHSRPSRVGSLEHGISKNRWSSYSGTRATRFDECQDAGNTSNNTTTDEVLGNGQSSLLEVFEAELAKKISVTDTEEAPEAELRTPVAEPAIRVDTSSETAIDHCIRTTVSEFVEGIARGMQELSRVSYQAADRTRDADFQLVDDAILGFRSLTEGFTAALGREIAKYWPGTPSASHTGPREVVTGSSSIGLTASHDRYPHEDVIIVKESNESPLGGGVDLSERVYRSRRNNTAAPNYIADISVSQQLEMEHQPRSRPAMSQEPRFLRPGPIRLPNSSRYVDYLRRFQSVESFDEQYNIQSASSPPVEIHTPTLAQFEGENIGPPRFPALPGMEPLIPQRAQHQSIESGPVNGSHSYISGLKGAEASQRSYSLVAGPREQSAQLDGHEFIPLKHPNSAARLAGPFDPLETEPSAQPDLTEEFRPNAAIASTDIRHSARRRRPYSEVFDGSGRVAWGTFLRDDGRGPKGFYRASDDRGRPLGANQEHTERLYRREEGSRHSALAAAGYDDQHHDDSTVGKINECVEQLRELFGVDDHDSAHRLLVYAQAADGVLEGAIELIDEEQMAYRERL